GRLFGGALSVCASPTLPRRRIFPAPHNRDPQEEKSVPDTSRDVQKRVAADRAAESVVAGMIVGPGTGSTVRFVLEHLGKPHAAGSLRDVVGVPTSEDTFQRATALGIPLGALAEHPRLDLTIDGADEVDPALNLVKGLGGALLREKIVAAASARL